MEIIIVSDTEIGETVIHLRQHQTESLKKYEQLFYYLVNIEDIAKCRESANQPVQ